MTEATLSREGAQARLRELQAEVQRLRQEERQVEEEIARLQSGLSRGQRQDRRRAQVNMSASLPALQVRRRSLGADVFRLEQEIRALRERLEQA